MGEKVNKGEWYMLGMASGGSQSPDNGKAKPWNECTKSTNWKDNAAIRYMNILSDKMSSSEFKHRVAFQKDRGCNYVNLFVTNEGDGEFAGYSIWGGSPFTAELPNATSKMMIDRIKYCTEQDLGVWVWLLADDSGWNSSMISHPTRFVNDLSKGGFLDKNLVSGVCLGLEMNDYFNGRFAMQEVAALHKALRQKWSGAIGTHHTTYDYRFYKYCNVLFYQTEPGDSYDKVVSKVNSAYSHTHKAICAFEMEWDPDRAKCEYVLKHSDAFSVGNW